MVRSLQQVYCKKSLQGKKHVFHSLELIGYNNILVLCQHTQCNTKKILSAASSSDEYSLEMDINYLPDGYMTRVFVPLACLEQLGASRTDDMFVTELGEEEQRRCERRIPERRRILRQRLSVAISNTAMPLLAKAANGGIPSAVSN